MQNKKSLAGRLNTGTLLYTIMAILMGLILGAIIFAIVGFNPLEAYGALFKGVFGDASSILWMVVRAAPIMLTGLSVTFAFKTGLFNVGAEGQFIVGTIAAVAVGSLFEMPAIIHVPLTLGAGMLAGGLWGGIAGMMKSRRGVSEVISTIMLNWIAFHLNNFMLTVRPFTSMYKTYSLYIKDTAAISLFQGLKNSEAGKQMMADNSPMGQVLKTPVNYGIIIALACVVAVWYILKRTTLGYELKAVGYNPLAAEYGGIAVRSKMFQSMFISGLLAGLAGAVYICGNTKCIALLAVSEGFGFDGMAVSFIGASTPVGTMLSAFLYSTLQYGGLRIQGSIGAPSEVINIVTGVMVFMISMPKLMQLVSRAFGKTRKGVSHD